MKVQEKKYEKEVCFFELKLAETFRFKGQTPIWMKTSGSVAVCLETAANMITRDDTPCFVVEGKFVEE